MNRWTAYVAGVVSALAVCAVAVGFIAASATTPKTAPEAQEIAAQFDVEVVWYDTETNPCPTESSLGCYISELTPDVIYIRDGMGAALTDSVILHEIGHVMQSRLGLPFDECGAEDFARSLGAAAIYPEC